MDTISKRYLKLKGRPSKRKRMCSSNVSKRWDKNNVENSNIEVFDEEHVDKCFEANKKLVEAFLKIGKGHAALEVFSMAIGIHAMDKKTFSKCLHKLYEEKQAYKDDILEMSRKIIRQKHNEIESPSDKNDVIDIAVSYDGTWYKRGYTSQYGIGIVVDILTGLVIDFEILSKYCPECTTAKRDLGRMSSEFDIWYKAHKPDCSENYEGSSNAMEVKAAEILWKRSRLKTVIFILASLGLAALASLHHEPIHHPQPFKFGYSVKDKHGEQHREEVGDGKNVKGSYGFTDARGIHRQVNYVADHAGFRAQVKTNEPGTANQNPAAVQIISDAPYGYGGYAGAPGLGYAGMGGEGYGYGGVGAAGLGYEGNGAAGLGYGYGDVGAAGLGYGNADLGAGGLGNNYAGRDETGLGSTGLGRYGGLGNGAFDGLGYARYGY
ncbi:unnamed protein product [Larinioides sclopetarius]|uniref:Mutator-like transposase domain-containing protein n=1 Tax=Larinioides sclopetarius TaxID=280406 RepID=A0AAV2ACJ2_9ARAC